MVVFQFLASLKNCTLSYKKEEVGYCCRTGVRPFIGNTEPSTLWLLMCSGPCSLPVGSPQHQWPRNAVAAQPSEDVIEILFKVCSVLAWSFLSASPGFALLPTDFP